MIRRLMLIAMLAAALGTASATVSKVTSIGIPSSVRQDCEQYAVFISEIKEMQIAGKTPDDIFDSLVQNEYLETYAETMKGIIRATFNEIATPESLKEKEYKECLSLYKSK